MLLWSRDQAKLDAAAAGIARDTGAETATVAADAARPDAADRVLAGVRDTFGSVDVAILNAGGPPPVDPLATTPDAWRDALQLLLLTPVAIATGLLPAMRERRWGRIVAVLSSGIVEPIPNLVYSNAGRSALAAWLKTASAAVAADGVTINGVVPGRHRDAAGRVARPGARRVDGHCRSRTCAAQSEAAIPAGRYGDPARAGRRGRVPRERAGRVPDRRVRQGRRRTGAVALGEIDT